MEVMHQIYRDPETGKVWEFIGGQEPRELDETFVKLLDIDSLPVLQPKGEKKVICPNCGTAVEETAAFCSECGEKLKVICPNCGTNVKKTPFCPMCGTKL